MKIVDKSLNYASQLYPFLRDAHLLSIASENNNHNKVIMQARWHAPSAIMACYDVTTYI